MLILSQVQVEERRYGLERYLQLISQDTRLSQTLAFNGFLLASQQETHADPERTKEVEASEDIITETDRLPLLDESKDELKDE